MRGLDLGFGQGKPSGSLDPGDDKMHSPVFSGETEWLGYVSVGRQMDRWRRKLLTNLSPPNSSVKALPHNVMKLEVGLWGGN